MAKTTPTRMGKLDRPHWLPWSVFPFQLRFTDIDGKRIHYIDEGSGPALLLVSAGQWSFMFRDVIVRLRGQFRCLTLDFPGSGLSPDAPGHDHTVQANAQILEGFIDALDLQDITIVVHDVGGPLGFLVATRWPHRFRALVISNTFGWPLASYPPVRRALKAVSSRPFGTINSLTNVAALFTASRYGVGRHMSEADRRAFLGPWRSRRSRRATQNILAGVLRIDPMMAEVEQSLRTALAGLPVLTLFGHKNDRYGWQDRFQQIFPHATAAGINDGHHFPFNDDPDAYSAAISAWWAKNVATADGKFTNLFSGVNQMSASNVLGKGRTALVTGASRGIGPLIAAQIAREGGHVVLTGRSAADLKAVTTELTAEGADVSFIPADLTQPGAAQALVRDIEREHGGIDLLANNAGGDPLREFHTMTIEENLRTLQLNLIAPLALSHAALPGMLGRGRGHIITISAMAGRVSFPYTEVYAAAKDGLIGFTRVLRSDYHARGVSASVLILGAIRGAGQGQRMLDESGMKASGFMAPAESVARAVTKAVKKDRAELVIMPGPGRLLRAIMDYFPALGPALNRAAGATTTMQKIIEQREAKTDAAA
jgi:haloalkane dehalogenase